MDSINKLFTSGKGMIFKRNRHAAEDMVRQQVPKRPRQPDPEEDQRYSPSDHPAPFRQPRESQLPRNTRVQKPVVDTPDTQSTRFYPSIPGSTHGQLRSQPVRPLDQHTERQQEPRAREVPNHRARPLNSIQDASPGVRQPLLGDSHKTPLIPVGAWAAGSENEQSGDTGLSDNHKKLEQENDRLSEELDLLRKKYATLETSNQKKLEKAAKENESLRDKLQDAEDAIESTSNSHHKLEKKYNDLCERHERLWKENEALNARHQRLMGTDKALQVKYNKLVAEDRNLEAKFRELEKHSASVQADLYEALEREETRKKEELAKGPSLPKIADDIITGKWKALEISIRNLVMNHLSWTTHASLELVNGPHGGISGCTTMRKGTELCLVENSMELGLAILRAFIWRFLSQAVFFNEYGVWGGEFGARFSAACQCLPTENNDEHVQAWITLRTRGADLVDTQIGIVQSRFIELANNFVAVLLPFAINQDKASEIRADVLSVVNLAVELHAIFMKSRAMFLIWELPEEVTFFDLEEEFMQVYYRRANSAHPNSSAMFISPALVKKGNADGWGYDKHVVMERAQVII